MEKARGEGGKFITAGKKKRMERMKTVRQGENPHIQHNDIENDEGDVKWCEGRRVVELGCLAESLGKCKNTECTRVLDLRNTIIERQIGLGSVLLVKCECGEMNRVRTGKTHREKNKGVPIFDMNTKVAEGMLHAGLSQTAVIQIYKCRFETCQFPSFWEYIPNNIDTYLRSSFATPPVKHMIFIRCNSTHKLL